MKWLLSILATVISTSTINLPIQNQIVEKHENNEYDQNSYIFGYTSKKPFGISKNVKIISFIEPFIEEFKNHLEKYEHDFNQVNTSTLTLSSELNYWDVSQLNEVIETLFDGGKIISETYKTILVDEDKYEVELTITYEDKNGDLFAKRIYNGNDTFTEYQLNSGKWGLMVEYSLFKGELEVSELEQLDSLIWKMLEFNNNLYIATEKSLYKMDKMGKIKKVDIDDEHYMDLFIFNNELYVAAYSGLYKIDKNENVTIIIEENRSSRLPNFIITIQEFNEKLYLYETGGELYSIDKNGIFEEILVPSKKNIFSTNPSHNIYTKMVVFNNELYISGLYEDFLKIDKNNNVKILSNYKNITTMEVYNNKLYFGGYDNLFRINEFNEIETVTDIGIKGPFISTNIYKDNLYVILGEGLLIINKDEEVTLIELDKEFIIFEEYQNNLYFINDESSLFYLSQNSEIVIVWENNSEQLDLIICSETFNNSIYFGNENGSILKVTYK